MPAGGSCLLGSLNLAEFVDEDTKRFNFSEFKTAVEIAVIGLNEVLEEGLNLHPLEEQRESVRRWHQIGLGIFGLADALIKMEITYGSKAAIDICDDIGYSLANTAIATSAKYSNVTDENYYMFDLDTLEKSIFYRCNTTPETKDLVRCFGLFNSQLLTIAPTGSLSSMLGVSGGIEPIYANSYTRKTESLHGEDKYYKVYTPIVAKYMEEHGLKEESELPEYFVTAMDIKPVDRIEMQSVWQDHIDASISSTINLPNIATIEDIEEIYTNAWVYHLKGVTIYRDGCNREGILSTDDSHKEQVTSKDRPVELARGEVIKVNNDCLGLKRSLRTGCGTLHCEAFFDTMNGHLVEMYCSKGSTGGCNNFMIGLSRMVSLSARGGLSIDDIIDQLMSCGTCPSYSNRTVKKHDTSIGSSCPVAIGYALKDMYKQMQDILKILNKDTETINIEDLKDTVVDTPCVTSKEPKCPECGMPLIFEGGCNTCKSCGYTKCD